MIELGLLVGFIGAAIIGLPIFLIRNSRWYHDRHHQRYSELMCDHCHLRYWHPDNHGERYARWPLRVMGNPPPRGTG